MGNDIRLAVGFWTHHKTVKLERRLGLEGVKALLMLWTWTAQNRPTGTLDGMSVEDLEIAAGWSGEDGALISELVNLRWLDLCDDTFSAHGWQEHQPWVVGAENRKEKARKAVEVRWEKARSTQQEYSEHTTSILTVIPSSSPFPSQENIPTTSETAVPEPVGTSPNQDKPTAAPTVTPKAEPAQRPDRPAQCPPEDWTKYLRFSRGFHTDKANQLGARAPFTDAKVLDGAKALDTLIRVRGRPEDEVLAVLGWSIEDPFWSTNLRSIKALLKTSSSNGELKYSNVLTAMTRDLERRAERSMAANG